MKSSVIHTLLVAGIVTALAGCQSAGRWAWWNRGNASDAAAVAETSAAPALPSEGATPQAVAVAGLEPARSPSASNLAATGVSTGVTQVSVPPLVAPGSTASSSVASATTPIPGVPAIPGVTPTQQLAAGSAGSPYDPNAYKPSTTSAVSGASAASDVPTVADRYAVGSADRYAKPSSVGMPAASDTANASVSLPSAADGRYSAVSVAAATNQNASADNRYAAPSAPSAAAADRYSQMFTEPSPSPDANQPAATTSAAVAGSTANTGKTSTPPDPVERPSSTATVQLKSPAGQYRPGGTSSYTVAPVQHMEIATLPSAPPSTQVPATTAPSASGVNTDTLPITDVPTTGTGGRTY